MFCSQLLFGYFEELGNQTKLVPGYPDIARFARAALTALLAGEVQAIGIPFSSHVCTGSLYVISRLLLSLSAILSGVRSINS